MNRLQVGFVVSIILGVSLGAGRPAHAGDWLKLLDHPRAGTNTIALVNADTLKLGASKLKHFKGGEQKGDAGNLEADLPPLVKKAALSAFLDLDTLDPVWEMGSLIFEKNKLPTPKGIADHVNGYIDKIAGKNFIYSPRNRYIILDNADRLTVHKPADRAAVANWARGLSKPAAPIPDYLKHAAEKAGNESALVLAIDLADTFSPVPLKEKTETLESLADLKARLDDIVKLVGDLQGVTLTVELEDEFQGRLQFDFSAAPTLLQKVGKAMVLEIFARRGILFPEMNEWEGHVEGKALVLSGPFKANSIVSLLTLFTSSPTADGTPGDASSGGSLATTEEQKTSQASKRYFTSVSRAVEEARSFRGNVSDHGTWNEKLARKIDQLPVLNVDKDLLDYGADVSQLLRGAGVTIRQANIVAGTQYAPTYTANTNYGYGIGYGGGYAYGAYSVNDNTFYNHQVQQQAKATGMTQHLNNLEQIQNMTAAMRRKMTEKYQVEF